MFVIILILSCAHVDVDIAYYRHPWRQELELLSYIPDVVAIAKEQEEEQKVCRGEERRYDTRERSGRWMDIDAYRDMYHHYCSHMTIVMVLFVIIGDQCVILINVAAILHSSPPLLRTSLSSFSFCCPGIVVVSLSPVPRSSPSQAQTRTFVYEHERFGDETARNVRKGEIENDERRRKENAWQRCDNRRKRKRRKKMNTRGEREREGER